MAMDRKRIRRPTLPGEILAELYLRPYRVSIAKFAEAAGLSRKHVSALIHGRSAMTAATATRIAAVLGTSAQFWLNMQAAVDLYDADESLRHSERKPRRLPVFNAAA